MSLNTKIAADIQFILNLQRLKVQKQPNGGWDINLFKSSFLNKVKTMAKNGRQQEVDEILEYLNTKQKESGVAPVFTANHSIWSFASDKTSDSELSTLKEADINDVDPEYNYENAKQYKFIFERDASIISEAFGIKNWHINPGNLDLRLTVSINGELYDGTIELTRGLRVSSYFGGEKQYSVLKNIANYILNKAKMVIKPEKKQSHIEKLVTLNELDRRDNGIDVTRAIQLKSWIENNIEELKKYHDIIDWKIDRQTFEFEFQNSDYIWLKLNLVANAFQGDIPFPNMEEVAKIRAHILNRAIHNFELPSEPISQEAQNIIKPEWDKMQEFLNMEVSPEVKDYYDRHGKKEAFLYNNRIGFNKGFQTSEQHNFNHNWIKDQPDFSPTTETQPTEQTITPTNEKIEKVLAKLRGNYKPNKTAFHYVFDRLTLKIAPDLLSKIDEAPYITDVYGKSQYGEKDNAYMALSLEGLERDEQGRCIFAMSHYYEQNGDLMCDPCMTIRIDLELKTVEALTFKMDGIFNSRIKEVYMESEDGRELVNLSEKKSQNSFLNQWTNNLVNQKHIVTFREIEPEEVDFTAPSEEQSVSEELIVERIGPITEENSLSKQLSEKTKSEYDPNDFEESENDNSKSLIHKPTGKQFLLPSSNEFFESIDTKYKNQFTLNRAIEEFLNSKDESYIFSDEEKSFIYQYEGYGGLVDEGAKGNQILWEYYTPKLLVQKMWGLAYKYGFSSGKVLEPSVGVGRFLDYSSNNTNIAYEINPYSARICKILHPSTEVRLKSFEEHFYIGNRYNPNFEKGYDLVIGNPPYGEYVGKRSAAESKRLKASVRKFEHYFILRGLDLLKPGGLLIYVSTANLFTKGFESVKGVIAQNSDLVDAYLLPNKTFARTKVNTSIVVLKKK